jgi:hypothetical protein
MNIHSHESIDYSQAAVERELCNLRSREFTVRIPELDNGFVVPSRIPISTHAVKAGLFYRVVHRRRIIQVYRFGDYRKFGGVARVRRKDEGTDVVFLA